MTTLADTFDRADNGSSLGSTSTGNVPWSALRGTWGIHTNRAYVSATVAPDVNLAVVETGSADGTVTVTMGAAGATSNAGLIFRAADVSNHYVLEGGNGSTAAQIYKCVAGTYTSIGQTAGNVHFNTGDVVEVVLSGTSIIAKLNGATIITLTDSTYTTQTRHGMYNLGVSAGGSNGAYFDSFGFTDPPAAITGTLFATLPKLTASLAGTYVVGTDVSNRDWARRRGGIGLVTVELPVAPVPPTRTRAPRYTKAVPTPTPTMVDGRPT